MQDDLSKILVIIQALEEAEEQVRLRQMKERSEESTKELTELHTDPADKDK
ncbi:MAG: hypothetical protein PHX78_06120 [bacterium]|nr:hypothetical protein [bacterium]